MKKFQIKSVFDRFQQPSVTPPVTKNEHVEIEETLKADHFQVAKTVRHGFPYQPTTVAFDPLQKVLAVGTKHGSIRIIGRPGVDVHANHETDAAVIQLVFVINKGAFVSATADDHIHMWNYQQKKPEIIHSLKFQRERITRIHLPFKSKWLYVGTERGNIHVVNIETFQLSGYIVNWNKAIELSRKTHPGCVVHLSDCPVDPSKLLIGYETGQIVVWDLRNKAADTRYQSAEPLRSISWHHEGKQFMCSHTDGSLTTWFVKQPAQKPISSIFPHAKTNKDGKQEPCKSIEKVDWTCTKAGESFVIFSGGLTNDRTGRTPSITVIHGKTTTVLEMEHNVVDFITLCETPWPTDFAEPYALVVLLHNDLVVVDLLSQGYPCFENRYSMDIHEAPVTCCTYLADCPADIVPALYSVGARSQKRTGFSEKDWPINGGEWGTTTCSYIELIITGHSDGSVKFWDATAVTLQVLYKLKTAKVFEKPRTRSIEGDEDPFAIQNISLCPNSRLLCIAGATSHVILFKYCKTESISEVPCLEIPIIYEVYESGDCSPEYEFPPRPTLQASLDYFVSIHVKGGDQKKAPGYQADLVCLTPWVNGEPPGAITCVTVNSSYGLLAYGNESGLVIVDYIQKVCLLNMGTPELYGSADPYQRVPRSPKKPDSTKDKEEERSNSPSSDQEPKDDPNMYIVDSKLIPSPQDSKQKMKLESQDDSKRKLSDSKNKTAEKDAQNNGRKISKGKEKDESKIDLMKLLGIKENKNKGTQKEEQNKTKVTEAKPQEEKLPDVKIPEPEEIKPNENNKEASEGEEINITTDVSAQENILGDPKLNIDVDFDYFKVEHDDVDKDDQLDIAKNTNNQDGRKQSKFRLKDRFNKLDAKVRRAFSWEHSNMPDGLGNPETDPEESLGGNPDDINDKQLQDVEEKDIEEGCDALAADESDFGFKKLSTSTIHSLKPEGSSAELSTPVIISTDTSDTLDVIDGNSASTNKLSPKSTPKIYA